MSRLCYVCNVELESSDPCGAIGGELAECPRSPVRHRVGERLPRSCECPACGSIDDWHPDPSGPNGEAWMVCEACGLCRDHFGNLAVLGNVWGSP